MGDPLNRGSTDFANCEACPLSNDGRPNHPVVSEYPDDPMWFIVGEGHGFHEVRQGRPFCLVPETKVLMADLSWRDLGDVVVGDKIFTIDENSGQGWGVSGAEARKWRIAEVTAFHRRFGEAVQVDTPLGTLVGSDDHRVLVRSAKGLSWLEMGSLQTANRSAYASKTGRSSRIVFFEKPWEQNRSYEGAWLAGFLDGEGHVLGSRPDRQRGGSRKKKSAKVGFTQNAGPTYDRAVKMVEAVGYSLNAKEEQRAKGIVCNRVTIRGDVATSAKFLGEIRPERLIENFRVAIEGRYTRDLSDARVLARKKVGQRELIDITTTAGTFIANGFVVHNCGASGQVVNKILHKIGRPREHLYVTNATLCMPPQGASVEVREAAAACCKPRLLAELAQYPGKPVLTLGAVAARSVIPKEVLDAIDPPDVPKTRKKAQKERGRLERKAQAKAEKAAQKLVDKNRKGIEKVARKRYAAMLKIKADEIFRTIIRRHGRKPDRRYMNEALEPMRKPLWERAWTDAKRVYAQIVEEKRFAKLAAPPKPPKPRKKKPLKITDIVGTLFDIDVDGTGIRPLVPAIHPAALLRGGGASIGGSHTPDMAFINIIYDAAKCDALAKGKDIRLKIVVEYEVHDAEKAAPLFLSILQEIIDEGSGSLDLETYVDDPLRHHALMAWIAKIRVVGLSSSKRAVSVAWDLLPSWCFSYLQIVLGNCTINYHHGLYDRTVLRAYGFMLPVIGLDTEDHKFGDSLYMHHAAFPGNAHKLQVVTSQFYGVRPWKCLRGDVEVLLPDRSTTNIRDFVRKRLPEVLSYESGQIVAKKVTGWHEQPSLGQEWVSVRTSRCDNKYTRGLIVTPDHRVMTQRGLVEAQQLVPDDDRIAIDEPQLSEDQISAALGTLLGDSSLFVSRVYHKRPWDARRASIRGGHANQGLRDCKVAALSLGTSCQMVPAHERQSRGVTIRAANFYAYGTTWAYQYMDLAKLVYDEDWKRRIKPEALKVLGRRGLAMMFMDDGDLKRVGNFSGAGFATNGFPVEDVELFAQWLRENYGPTSIYQSSGPYCSLSAEATRNMLEDLRGYIHPSVGYKTTHEDPYKEVQRGSGAYFAAITSVDSIVRDTSTKRKRLLADNRYCLTVEDTKLFYTNYGLVSNSEFRNAEETPEKLAEYNGADTFCTHADVSALTIWIKRTATEKVYDIDRKMVDVASEMHLRGMPIDREINSSLLSSFTRIAKESKRIVEEKAAEKETQDNIRHHLAIMLAQKHRKGEPDDLEKRYEIRLADIGRSDWYWNVNNSKHVAALLQAVGVQLTATTAGGAVSTKKDVLEGLVNFPIVRDLLSYRENEKMRDFVWPIFDREYGGEIIQYGFADGDDRIHPIWSIHKISGRWAGSEPFGVSNPPREHPSKPTQKCDLPPNAIIIDCLPDGSFVYAARPTTKRQVVARKGRKLVGFDFAQIEARILALLSGDDFMCDVFAREGDLHIECALVVFPGFADRPEKERKMMRTVCKTLEYATWYGANDETVWKGLLKEGYNFKLVDVQHSLAVLRKKMPGIVSWQRATILAAARPPHELRGMVLGRRRVWPMGQVDQGEALNIVPQTTGAEIMDLGMYKMSQRIHDRRYRDCFPIVQVHDAAVYECDEDDAEAVQADLVDCFSYEHSNPINGRTVKFPIDPAVDSCWMNV